MRKRILDDDTELALLFGDMVWEELCHKIIRCGLLPSIPPHTVDLKDYQRDTMVLAQGFEKRVAELGFYNSGGTETIAVGREGLLTSFLGDIETHFAQKKQRRILKKTRQLLVSKDYTSIEVSSRDLRQQQQRTLAEDEREDRERRQEEEDASPTTTASEKIREKKKTEGDSNNGGGSAENRQESADASENTQLLENVLGLEDVSVFKFPRCHVAVSSVKLMELICDTMEEACQLVTVSPQW